jgi:hypothetical protein
MDAPTIHACFDSRDFDVPMHNNHEGAEVRVETAIGCARIMDQLTAVVHVGDLRAAGLVCPVTVPPFPIPMEIPVRADDACDEVALLRVLVICVRAMERRSLI